MASDDMHVVMYKILSYLYKCMKEGVRPDKEKFSAEALGINYAYWSAIVSELAHRKLIAGVRATRSELGDTVYVSNPRVTMDGVEFLLENSMMAKAKDFVLAFKDFVPLP